MAGLLDYVWFSLGSWNNNNKNNNNKQGYPATQGGACPGFATVGLDLVPAAAAAGVERQVAAVRHCQALYSCSGHYIQGGKGVLEKPQLAFALSLSLFANLYWENFPTAYPWAVWATSLA